MAEPFIGSEAVASGALTPYALRSTFVPIHRNVFIPQSAEVTAVVRAKAAWLWSRRRGVVSGFSASALHGAKWIDRNRPAEIIYENRHAPSTIKTWSDRIEDDELMLLGGIKVATPARTAIDIACRYPVAKSVAAIDALAFKGNRSQDGGCRTLASNKAL